MAEKKDSDIIKKVQASIKYDNTTNIIEIINAISEAKLDMSYLEVLRNQISEDIEKRKAGVEACRAEDPCGLETCLAEFCYARTCLTEFCYVRTCASEFCKIHN